MSSLRTATAQNYDNLQIIVSDNCSTDNTQDVVAEARDPRIRYVNTRRHVSMSSNWEFALTHVKGGWVTFMGDDDGLLPYGVPHIADIIGATDLQAIRTEYCTYDWPGIPEHPRGQLVVPLSKGTVIRDSQVWLHKSLKGYARYSQLPMIYNGGFIDMSIINDMRHRTGRFFNSVNPDVYSAIAIARATDKFMFVREPIAISGTSTHSNGHSAFSVNGARNRATYSAFLAENDIQFHRDLPLSAGGGLPLSLQACVYEAYLQSSALSGGTSAMTHTMQLAVILASSGKHREDIYKWGRLFSAQHKLDYARAVRSAERLRPALQALSIAQRLDRTVRSVVTDRLELHNVFEASIAASVIRAAPTRIDSLRFLTRSFADAIRHIANRSPSHNI